MATREDVLDRVTDLMEMKDPTTRTRLENWVGFVCSEMKQAGILGPEATNTISLVAGTATYNMPSGVDQVDSIYIEDNLAPPLVFKPRWEFAEFLADDDDLTGTPEYYTFPNRPTGGVTHTIRVYPIPDAAKTLRVNYQANFAALDEDADILELKDDLFTTCVWGVYRIGARFLEDGDISAATEEFRVSLARGKMSQWGRPGRLFSMRYREFS